MYYLLKKEINSFLGSFIGYIVLITFLLANSLFLWVFSGSFNIIDNSYASLDGLFELAPWLYLFLVPAITMRLFAEEKKQGTMEVLLTRPLSDSKIIIAKYLGGLLLVILSLLPTLVYFYSVYQIGSPVGNIDIGGTWGSFTGLFFLAAIYVAIGLFASSLSDNQIVAFIVAMVFSFIFYVGFDFIAQAGMPNSLANVFSWLSINEHYLAVSRGVLELSDLVYFVGMVILILGISKFWIRKGSKFNRKSLVKQVLFFTSILLICIFSTNSTLRIDLTGDKRYSVSEATKSIVSELDETLYVELYLAGDMPAGLKRLQKAIEDKANDLDAYAPEKIQFTIKDPLQIKKEKQKAQFIERIESQGIKPFDVRNTTDQGVVTTRLYPGAILNYGGKQVSLNFLKRSEGFSNEMNLNHSIEGIEFEFANAIRRLTQNRKGNLAFLKGHGELNQWDVYDISNSLLNDFYVSRITVEQLSEAPGKQDIIIVAGPNIAFNEKDKIVLDQYLMQGGKIMWFIDPVRVSLDSLSKGHMTMAFPLDLNLGDMLFKYGVRLNRDLIQDVYCSQLLVNTAAPGTEKKFTRENWYYSPLLTPSDHHPLSKNLNLVMSEFVSSIDTVSPNENIEKTVLLSTSPYGRKVRAPAGISLENINNPPAREMFNVPFIPTGILLEGRFESAFKNRMLQNLGYAGNIIEESKPTKMMVFSDASLLANQVIYSGDEPQMVPLGYDRVSQRIFGNKEYILNAIHYLNDEVGIMQLRNRTLKLRLLDKAKLRETRRKWQLLNVLLPVILVVIFGSVYNLRRYYKFSR